MIDIIVPVYNGVEFLKQCIESVEKETHTDTWQLVIADDNSPDPETQKYLKNLKHQVIRNKTERGFPANCNYAVSRTWGEFIVLLNSDTVVTKGWLKAMLDEMEDPQVAVVGCKLVFPEGKRKLAGRLQHAGVCRNASGYPYHPFYGGDPNDERVNVRRELNAVTFACAMIRRSVWDELHGLDREFQGGQFEDVSYCWTCRRRGYKVVFTPKALVYHYEHGAGEHFVSETEGRNLRLLLQKWGNLGSDEDLMIPIGLANLDTPEMREAFAAFFHQVRGAAMTYACNGPKSVPAADHKAHCLRLANMGYTQLPDVEKDWAMQWASTFVERLKHYETLYLSRNSVLQPRATPDSGSGGSGSADV